MRERVTLIIFGMLRSRNENFFGVEPKLVRIFFENLLNWLKMKRNSMETRRENTNALRKIVDMKEKVVDAVDAIGRIRKGIIWVYG